MGNGEIWRFVLSCLQQDMAEKRGGNTTKSDFLCYFILFTNLKQTLTKFFYSIMKRSIKMHAVVIAAAVMSLFSCQQPKLEGLYRCDYNGDKGLKLEMYLNVGEEQAELAIHHACNKSVRYTDLLKSTSMTKTGKMTDITFVLPGDPTSAAEEENEDRTFVMSFEGSRLVKVDKGLLPMDTITFNQIAPEDTVENGAFAKRIPHICIDPRCWMAYGPVAAISENGLTYHYDENGFICSHPEGTFCKENNFDWSKPSIYNEKGLEIHMFDASVPDVGWMAFGSYGYNPMHQLVSVQEQACMVENYDFNGEFTFYYNAKGQLTKVEHKGNVMVFRYDMTGNIASLTNIKKNGEQSVANYDIQEIDEYGNPTVAVYQGSSNNRTIKRSYTYR